ncbi:MAG TPA: hypothetical protein PLD75_09170, partial [Spirochaetota bacterium]|nr:hypothetical protein [Spirochaetota bacterium]
DVKEELENIDNELIEDNDLIETDLDQEKIEDQLEVREDYNDIGEEGLKESSLYYDKNKNLKNDLTDNPYNNFLDLPDLPAISLDDDTFEENIDKNLDLKKDTFNDNEIVFDNIFNFPPIEDFVNLEKTPESKKNKIEINKKIMKEDINVTTKMIKGIEIDFFE